MADGRHIENSFGHNSAADCPISVKMACGRSFHGMSVTRQIPVFNRTYFFLFSWCSLGFGERGILFSDTLVYIIVVPYVYTHHRQRSSAALL